MNVEEHVLSAPVLLDNFNWKSEIGIPLNETDFQAKTYGLILYFVGTVDFLVTLFLLIITYVTSAKDGMKLCEKLLVYNILFADVALEYILLFYIGPATRKNRWDPADADTVWTAFALTCVTFHSHIAMATVCYIIALSMTDAYRYEMSNDMKHTSVLVISNICLTVCFCSLPATEDFGYTVLQNWLGPSFNISFQYGSLFMCLGIMSLVCGAIGISIHRLMESRKFFQENKAKVNVRTLEEVDKDLVFCIISMVMSVLLLPLVIGVPNPTWMLLPRVVVYLFPCVRVTSLLTTCPLFQFAFFNQTEDMNDFDMIEGFEEHEDMKDAGPAALEILIEERMDVIDAQLAHEELMSEASDPSRSGIQIQRRFSTEL